MAQYSRQEVAPLDMEPGHDYDFSSEEEPQRRIFKSKYMMAVVLGGFALAGCGAAIGLKGGASAAAQPPKKLTARMLFESDAIHHAAAENVLNAHSKLPDATKSKEEVKELVAHTFRGIIQQMKTLDPETFNALENTEMTQEQHDGVAHTIKFLKDPRVMQLGLDTAAALREAGEAGAESQNQQAQAVYEKLAPRQAEIKALYDEVMPRHMQESFKYKLGSGFKSLLKPKNAKLLQTVGGSYYDKFTAPEKTIATTERRLFGTPPGTPYQSYAQQPQQPFMGNPAQPYRAMIPQPPTGHSYNYHDIGNPMTKALEALGIIGTVTGEADSILRVINPICKEYNHDLKVNPAITTALGGADFVFQVADCELDAVADHFNPVEALGCPAMAGSAGFDAAREMFTMTGILGDNNPADGVQGNHEGERKVHEGVFDDTQEGKAVEQNMFCWMFNDCKNQRNNNNNGRRRQQRNNNTNNNEDDDDYEEEEDNN